MTEYITVDVEMGFITSFRDVLNMFSGLISHVVDRVWETHTQELNALRAVKPVVTKNLPEITMKDLHELYFKEIGEDFRHEKDPAPAEERFISDYSAKNWGSEAVFITEFPATYPIMKFYHYRNEENPDVCDRADLIFRGVEIMTASRREHRYESVIQQLIDFGGDPSNPAYKYFLDAFKYGMPSHGGCGLGLERLTQKIIGLNNVKEATLFPRDMNRITP